MKSTHSPRECSPSSSLPWFYKSTVSTFVRRSTRSMQSATSTDLERLGGLEEDGKKGRDLTDPSFEFNLLLPPIFLIGKPAPLVAEAYYSSVGLWLTPPFFLSPPKSASKHTCSSSLPSLPPLPPARLHVRSSFPTAYFNLPTLPQF